MVLESIVSVVSVVGFLGFCMICAIGIIKVLDAVLDRFTNIWAPLKDLDLGEWEVEEGEIS